VSCREPCDCEQGQCNAGNRQKYPDRQAEQRPGLKRIVVFKAHRIRRLREHEIEGSRVMDGFCSLTTNISPALISKCSHEGETVT
jgi:hypothetical protein